MHFELGVHVALTIDYTCKYGIGYIMSNGMYGLYFNDNTYILKPANADRFITYYYKQKL